MRALVVEPQTAQTYKARMSSFNGPGSAGKWGRGRGKLGTFLSPHVSQEPLSPSLPLSRSINSSLSRDCSLSLALSLSLIYLYLYLSILSLSN